MKTSVTDFLDAVGVDYLIKPHTQPVYTCEDAARERGVRVSQIVKCMVGRDPAGQLHVMLIPGDKTLKIKRVRQLAGGIRIELVPADELASEFNLIVGAIAPIQLMNQATFYIDNSVFREEWVDISSGDPGAGVELKTEVLAHLLNAIRCDIISTSS